MRRRQDSWLQNLIDLREENWVNDVVSDQCVIYVSTCGSFVDLLILSLILINNKLSLHDVESPLWFDTLSNVKGGIGRHCIEPARREFLREILYNNIAIIAIQHSKIYFVDVFGDFPHTDEWNSLKSVWQISLYTLA